MAKDLKEIFGDRLFIPTTTELFNVLPSPNRLVILFIVSYVVCKIRFLLLMMYIIFLITNSLRGKVVLKGHRSDVTEDDFEGSDIGTDDGEDLQLLREV